MAPKGDSVEDWERGGFSFGALVMLRRDTKA